MQRICVYCGSRFGTDSAYAEAARDLAEVLVRHDYELVYGGSSIGTMRIIADAMLERGGRVHGVIPKMLLDREIAHEGLTELHIVASMHERKSMMAALADGFVALPGGFGTLEELIEVVTWAQLGYHVKPCGVINVRGYFNHLIAMLDHARDQGFLRPKNRELLMCAEDAAELIQQFEAFTAPSNN